MEKQIKKLESIIQNLESEPKSLQDSIKEYEKGISTAKKIIESLEQSESEITILNEEKEKLLNSCQLS